MTVKADSKGRLTGAKPGELYKRRQDGDGTITFEPAVPEVYDVERSITYDQFVSFFGVPPTEICRDSIRPAYFTANDREYYPSGFVAKKFVLTPDGKRVYDGWQEPMTETIFIRIERE